MKINKLKTTVMIMLFLTGFAFLQSCVKSTESKRVEVKKARINKKIVKTERYGFINSISRKDGNVIVSLDFIDYKKIKDVDPSLKQRQKIELPNGYCYVNDEEKTDNFPISGKALVVMQTMDYDSDGNFKFNETIPLERLTEFYSKPESQRLKHEPFKVVLENDTIISIKEIYIP